MADKETDGDPIGGDGDPASFIEDLRSAMDKAGLGNLTKLLTEEMRVSSVNKLPVLFHFLFRC